MKARVKANCDWDEIVKQGLTLNAEIFFEPEHIDIGIETEKGNGVYPSFIFDCFCPICDGKGSIPFMTVGEPIFDLEEDIFAEEEELERLDILCHICDGRKTVEWYDMRKMHETKKKYCTCGGVPAGDMKHVSGETWIHTKCGKIIQE